MKNIIAIFKGDLKKISRNLVAWVVILGMTVVPCLYAWFNINASWDPYGKTEDLKIALASTDEGYKGELIDVELNLGDTLLSSVSQVKKFDWVITSEKKAIEGTKSGKYYAAVVVPESFSKDMMSIFSKDAQHSEIIYYCNEKENAIATKITTKGARTIQTMIDQVFAQEIAAIAFSTVKSLTDQDNTEDYKTGLHNAAASIRTVRGTVGAAQSSIKSLSSATKSIDSLLGSVENITEDEGSITGGIRKLSDGADKKITQIITDLDGSIMEIDDFLKALQELGLSDLDDVIAALDTLDGDLVSIQEGLDDTKSSSDEMVDNVDEVSSNLTDVAVSASGSLSKLRKALNSTAKALKSNHTELGQLAEDLDEAADSDDMSKVNEILSQDTEKLAEFIAAPVELNKIEVYKVENYGSSMAPFYTSLAIWVGAIVMVALMNVEVSEERKRRLTPKVRDSQLYFGRYIIFLLIGLIQAALICTGNLFFLGIQCVHPVLFMIAGLTASVVFSLLMFTLTISFGDIGKAVAVVLMVIQVAGSGGTFPIEMLNEQFQAIYPLLPFNFSMTAMREAVAGCYGNVFWTNIAKLCWYLAGALILGLVLRKPVKKLNHFLHRRLHDTGIM